jgi:hypothetical protein
MMSPSDASQSKGYTLRGRLAFIEQRYGKERIPEVLARLEDEDLRKVLSGAFSPSSWYPLRYQVRLSETIDKVLGKGDLQLCWEIGRFTAEFELSTIHAIFLKLGKPQHLLKMGALMWGRYYSTGRLQIESKGDNAAVGLVQDFDPVHRAFCMDFSGWMERTLELTGAQKVAIRHTACRLEHAPACRFEGSWE